MITYIGHSRPEYSILQSYGTKCTNCHINTQGGGARTLGGWMSRNMTSMVEPSAIGLGGVFDFLQNTNQLFDGIVTFGLDLRYQSAKWGGTQEVRKIHNSSDTSSYTVLSEPKRDHMLMQLDPYISIKPHEMIEFEGFYNLAYEIEDLKRYPGQQPYAFSAIFRPGANLPSLRVGFFQPAIGTKWDDHTLLIRQVMGASRGSLLLPHDYTEWGAQIDYEAIEWLGLSFGLFDSKNLHDALSVTNYSGGTEPIVSGNTMDAVARVCFYPPEIISGVTSFFGGYWFWNTPMKTDDGLYFANNYYTVGNLFFNIGMIDKFSLLTEFMWSNKQNLRKTNNFLVEFTYQPLESAYVYARWERANTDILVDGSDFHATQYVFGTKFFPLPYIGIIPEYRIIDKDHVEGYHSQWAFQVHLFY
ncbi:MAG: hypothetical protein A2X64_09500 [Ignavibacteria bacterium GWF2_33_9]|nr:MAG: hypothetical protein A2X64_09500 [Ignavibacteria bacterium GWF2_33_9]